MEWISIISLVVLGIVLIGLEIFFVPGTTIVGVLGFASCLTGVYFGYANLGNITGHILLGVTLVGPLVMFYIGVKFKVWNMFSLKTSVEGSVTKAGDKIEFTVGTKGITISALRPLGSAEINDEIIEVSSLGEYIDSSIEIEIIKITKGKIFVQPV